MWAPHFDPTCSGPRLFVVIWARSHFWAPFCAQGRTLRGIFYPGYFSILVLPVASVCLPHSTLCPFPPKDWELTGIPSPCPHFLARYLKGWGLGHPPFHPKQPSRMVLASAPGLSTGQSPFPWTEPGLPYWRHSTKSPSS